jgi:hypothetical protein
MFKKAPISICAKGARALDTNGMGSYGFVEG